MPEEDATGAHPVKIWIDDVEYATSAKSLTGLQLKELAQKPDAEHLFLEQGDAPDIAIRYDEVVQIKGGEHFRTSAVRKAYRIYVDEVEFLVESKEMTGAQIKMLAQKPENYKLFLERPGRPDKQIDDAEVVRIKEGEHFHTVPPANFG